MTSPVGARISNCMQGVGIKPWDLINMYSRVPEAVNILVERVVEAFY
jgi:hypothetical protein